MYDVLYAFILIFNATFSTFSSTTVTKILLILRILINTPFKIIEIRAINRSEFLFESLSLVKMNMSNIVTILHNFIKTPTICTYITYSQYTQYHVTCSFLVR